MDESNLGNKGAAQKITQDVEALVQSRTCELLAANAALLEEVRLLRQENTEFAMQLADAKMGSRSDRETRRAALNLMEDAVDARRAEQRENVERRRAESELRDADKRKDEFLAMLAHELRNPLAPIRNSMHILRMAGTDSGTAERIFEMLERQIGHMVRLVDDLMEVSRITRGQMELRKEQVELASIVRSAVETSRPMIEAACQPLAISLPADPIMLYVDPFRLSQVLVNLLNNASKYSDKGDQIWLTARCEETHVVFSVRDSGLGIPSTMLQKIFSLFTQVDSSLGRAQGGLGIGLTLVRSLIEAHGGSVEACSDGPGKGSEFIIRIPKVTTILETEKVQSASGGLGKLTPRRILVVDDNRDAAESLSTLLRFLGAEVYTVNDGEHALRALEAFSPSVALLDIGMPGMDGYEVARRARMLQMSQQLTLIALTGWGQENDRAQSKAAGFQHHLVKPVEIGVLQQLLESLPDELPSPLSKK